MWNSIPNEFPTIKAMTDFNDGYIALSEILLWEDNPKQHDIPRLVQRIRELGMPSPLIIRFGKLFAGHGRVEALQLIKKQGPKPDLDLAYPPVKIKLRDDGEWLVPFVNIDYMSEEQAREYAVEDNLISQRGKWDRTKLDKLFKQMLVKKEQTSFTPKQLRTIAESGKKPKPRPKTTYKSYVEDVPDAAFPCEPSWGITMLHPDKQATYIDKPFVKWGSVARSTKLQKGTFHFYTDDYKFEGLDRNPLVLVDTECINTVEPNFTTHPQMPKFEVLHRIGRKRWMARLWQEEGVDILVDLCISPPFRSLNLLGVPREWGAFCTRAYSGQEKIIQTEYDFVTEYCGKKPHLFVVYGGGNGIQTYCAAKDWVWFPEYQELVHGS